MGDQIFFFRFHRGFGKKKGFFLEGISRGFGMKVGMVYCNMLCFEDDYWIGGSQTKKATESAPSPIHVFFVWGLWLDMLLFGEYLKNMRLKTMTWRPVSSNVAGWEGKKNIHESLWLGQSSNQMISIAMFDYQLVLHGDFTFACSIGGILV